MSGRAVPLPPGAAAEVTGDAPLPGRVEVSVADGVARIVLANPAKLNAISEAMWGGVVAALSRCEADAALRCVVITGKGNRAFCSGADLAAKARAGHDADADADAVTRDALAQLEAFRKPTIAMVDGYCLGAGMAIALSCDLRVASPEARFGIPAARLGLAYFHRGAQRLAELVGPSRAKLMLFTADRVSAADALRFGLIDELAPAGQLSAVVADLAARIAGNAPLTVQAAKHAVDLASDGVLRDTASCLSRERACRESLDYLEGRRAFVEKRVPVFQGR